MFTLGSLPRARAELLYTGDTEEHGKALDSGSIWLQLVTQPARLKRFGGLVTLCTSFRRAHAIGKFGGRLPRSPPLIWSGCRKGALERAGVQPQQVEETIFGNARRRGRPESGAADSIRAASLRSSAYTVNKACASALSPLRWHSMRCHRQPGVRAAAEPIDVAASLLFEARAGISSGQSGTGRWHVSRRIFLSMAKMLMARRPRFSPRSTDFARRAGSVRAGVAAARRGGAIQRTIRRRNCSGHHRGKKAQPFLAR